MSDDNDFEEPGVKTVDKVQNQHFDEAVELESEGQSEIESAEEDRAELVRQQEMQQKQAQGQEVYSEGEGGEGGEGGYQQQIPIQGAYNPQDYIDLQVSPEVQELFKYIPRYKPITIDLDSKFRPFIPEYIPSVGEVDAFMKPDKPDGKEEILGLSFLDEPCLNQSKKATLDLMYQELFKKNRKNNQITVHNIKDADKRPKEILSWINDVGEVHKKKQPPSVSYSKQMPEIDHLMSIWPPEVEDSLNQLRLPDENIDLSVDEFARIACSIMDIPVYPQNQERNVIESLHVLFTLYSEFKNNQHFQQNKDEDQY